MRKPGGEWKQPVSPFQNLHEIRWFILLLKGSHNNNTNCREVPQCTLHLPFKLADFLVHCLLRPRTRGGGFEGVGA